MKPIILDNQAKTFDRYTIITPNGEVYGASVDPFHPQGFGQYCGDVVYLRYSVGAQKLAKKDGTYPKWAIHSCKRELIADFVKRGEKRVKMQNLPIPVQNYVKQLVNPQNTARYKSP